MHKVEDARHEDAAVGDDTFRCEPFRDRRRTFALRHDKHGRDLERARTIELRMYEVEGADGHAGENKDGVDETIEHPQERTIVLLNLFLSAKLGWTLWLQRLGWTARQ